METGLLLIADSELTVVAFDYALLDVRPLSTQVPEPGSMLLFSIGLLGIAGARRSRVN